MARPTLNSLVQPVVMKEMVMAANLKAQRWMNELTAANDIINDLVQENYELKQRLHELLGTTKNHVERDRSTNS